MSNNDENRAPPSNDDSGPHDTPRRENDLYNALSSTTTLSEHDTVWCAICQAAMKEDAGEANDRTEEASTLCMEHVATRSSLPLVTQLKHKIDPSAYVEPTASKRVIESRRNPDPADVVVLPGCGHMFHRECILKWINFDNRSCPLCRCEIDRQSSLKGITWRVRNLAVRTRCSPESIRLGLKPEGWYNIQLQIEPPAGRKIHRVRYVFHPAFSLNKLDIERSPFDLVMKLVSNSVEVVIDITCEDGTRFTIVHNLVKELCTRVFLEGLYNGVNDGPINSLVYFGELIDMYHRAKDYYGTEMEPPPRFSERRTEGPKKSAVSRFFSSLFQG